MRLVAPDVQYKTAYIDMMADWERSGEEYVPFTLRFDYSDFSALVKKLQGYERGEGLKEGFVNHSSFWLLDDSDDIVGTSNLRHTINERLLLEGGHIGYGVRPSARRNGHATEILRLTLKEAAKIGIDKALVTCDKHNIASAKTILKNRGVFWKEEPFEGKMVRKYWIVIDA